MPFVWGWRGGASRCSAGRAAQATSKALAAGLLVFGGEAVGKLRAVVRQDLADPDGRSQLEPTQEIDAAGSTPSVYADALPTRLRLTRTARADGATREDGLPKTRDGLQTSGLRRGKTLQLRFHPAFRPTALDGRQVALSRPQVHPSVTAHFQLPRTTWNTMYMR